MNKLTISGHTPPGMAAVTRKVLLKNGADFETLANHTHITTSRGRWQQRKKFHTELKRAHNDICKRTGKKLTMRITRKIYIDQVTKEYADEQRETEKKIKEESKAKREAIYRINSANAALK